MAQVQAARDPLDALEVSKPKADPLDALSVAAPKGDPLDALSVGAADPLDSLAVQDQKPGFGSKLLDIAKAAITPIPVLKNARDFVDKTIASGNDPLDKLALTGISDKAQASASPYLQAAIAARRSMVPLPSTSVLQTANQFMMPTTPLDLAGTAAAPFIPMLTKMLGKGGAVKVAENVMGMPAEELARHVVELERAGAAGVVKPMLGSTIKETLINLGEREARPKLDSETMLQGLHDSGAMFKDLTNKALTKIKNKEIPGPKETETVLKWLSNGLESGELPVEHISKYLNAPEMIQGIKGAGPMTQAEAARFVEKLGSAYGFGLGQLSKLRIKVGATLSPEARRILEQLGGDEIPSTAMIWYQNFNRFYAPIEQFRKAMMTTALRLAQRDVITHGANYTINTIEEGLNGVFGTLTGKQPPGKAFNAMTENILAVLHNLPFKANKQLTEVLEKFPAQAERMFGSPYSEMALPGKAMRMLNAYHKWSYDFFMRMGLDAELRIMANKAGVGVMQLPEEAVEKAITKRAELVFMKNFKPSTPGKPGSLMGDILRVYRNHPWLTSVGQTFPRMWANLLNRSYELSPMPLFSPSTYSKLASKDSTEAFGALSKVVTGMSIAALANQSGFYELGRDKWYEAKVGKRTVDLRGLHPLAAPIIMWSIVGRGMQNTLAAMKQGLPKGEAVLHGLSAIMDLKKSEWFELLVAMKRTDLSGIPLMDAFQASNDNKDPDKVMAPFLNFMGQYLASFEPALLTRSVVDIMGQTNPEDRRPKFVRDRPVMGPILQNIPFLNRSLPTRYSPLRGGPNGEPGVEEKDNPGIQQFPAGAVWRVKNTVETEADRLRLSFKDIYPMTKDEGYNNLVVKYMGPIAYKDLTRMISNPNYIKLKDETKALYFKMHVNIVKSASKDIALKDIPPARRIKLMEDQLDQLTRQQFKEAEAEAIKQKGEAE